MFPKIKYIITTQINLFCHVFSVTFRIIFMVERPGAAPGLSGLGPLFLANVEERPTINRLLSLLSCCKIYNSSETLDLTLFCY